MSLGIMERIDLALADGPLSYHELALRVFPDRDSWKYSRNGGPPGCYMTLSSALRRGGFMVSSTKRGQSNGARRVYPRSKKVTSKQ